MSSELSMHSIEELVAELKRRNISLILAYVDHNEFNKGPDQGIVWGCDGSGNLVLQTTLLTFLTKWLEQLAQQRTQPGRCE